MEESEDIIIPWENWFDKVYCLHYMPNVARLPRIQQELTRLDLWNNPIFELRKMVPQEPEKILLEWSSRQQGGATNIVAVGNAMENLRTMREAELMGYHRIMIIEDDAAFLNSKKEIIDILLNMPDDFLVLQMDKAIHNAEELEVFQSIERDKKVSKYFADCSGHNFTLATCNIYSEKGLRKYLDLLEKGLPFIDTIVNYLSFGAYIALRNMCIQLVWGTQPAKEYKRRAMDVIYAMEGINYADYALPLGYVK